MSRFEFPSLSVPEIVAHLEEFFPGKHYTEDDVAKPQPHKIKELYEDLLLQCNLGFTREVFNVQPFQSMYALQNPGLHEESYHLVTFSLLMERVLITCGLDDFKVWDLTNPKPKRTARFLSGLINFKKFSDVRMETYENIMVNYASLQDKCRQLLTAKDDIQSNINRIRAMQAEKAPQIEQMKNEIGEMNEHMKEMKTHCREIQNENTQTKATIADKTAKLDQIRCREVGNREEAEKISSRIVQSPEKMKNDISRMKHNIQCLKQAKDENCIKLQEHYVLRQNGQTMLENAKQGVKLILAIKAEQQKSREAEEQLVKIQDKKSQQKDVLSECSAKSNQMKRQCALKQEKVSKVMLQHESKMGSLAADLEETVKERDAVFAKRSENNKEFGKFATEKDKLLRNLETNEQSYEVEMKEMKGLYEDTLLHALEEYHSEIAETWNEINPVTLFSED
ncbi:kinetochore protein Nuf2-B-like [Glandiceps talaboti]